MTRLVHLSDLHFGTEAPELLAPLREAVAAARPALVVVSGDLTQRARRAQFRAAAAFLATLPAPWRAVPGNHDIPFHRPDLRLLQPFARYRDAIAAETAPGWGDAALCVQGLNTADHLAWQRGRVRSADVQRVCRAFAASNRVNVAFAHHPFERVAGSGKASTRHAVRALDTLAACGTHVLLSGHLHRWRTAPFVERSGGRRILQVHVGTGLSRRHRGEGNDFAILDLGPDRAAVTRMAYEAGGFRPAGEVVYRLGREGWRRPGA